MDNFQAAGSLKKAYNKIFEKGGETSWTGWVIGITSLTAMWLKAPERIVVIIAGIIGVIFLSS